MVVGVVIPPFVLLWNPFANYHFLACADCDHCDLPQHMVVPRSLIKLLDVLNLGLWVPSVLLYFALTQNVTILYL